MGTPNEVNGAIVVIDDDALNIKLVTTVLAKQGYAYFSAQSAEEGIELIRVHRPRLVLMDIHLPGVDGLTAPKAIKQDPDIGYVTVVILSAMGETPSALEAAGAAGVITKPFSLAQFSKSIAEFFENGTSTAYDQQPN